jgi:hypothetical protein
MGKYLILTNRKILLSNNYNVLYTYSTFIVYIIPFNMLFSNLSFNFLNLVNS